MKASFPPQEGATSYIAGDPYVCMMIVHTLDDVWNHYCSADKLTAGQVDGQNWWAIWVPQELIEVKT